MAMLQIDGSIGEGGGQVLRTALGLSLVTGQPFVMHSIRAGREKPGLKRQHLTAVLAATEVGDAEVQGAELGSQSITFKPKAVRAGDYRFAIGTAGSTTLVLQTVLPGLFAADATSTIELEGGTHNPLAPSFEFLSHAWAPLLRRMGAPIELDLQQHGFYPAGGGCMRASVSPASWATIDLTAAPTSNALRAEILISQLATHVAERETRGLATELAIAEQDIVTRRVHAAGPGNAVLVHVGLGEVNEVVTVIGARGVHAEVVAREAAGSAKELIAAKVPVGEHLADQLLIPMALAGGGAIRTVTPSLHTRTNAQVIELFLPVRFISREDGSHGSWVIEAVRA